MPDQILRLDASIRHTDSVTRDLLDRITQKFPDAAVTTRDLSKVCP